MKKRKESKICEDQYNCQVNCKRWYQQEEQIITPIGNNERIELFNEKMLKNTLPKLMIGDDNVSQDLGKISEAIELFY